MKLFLLISALTLLSSCVGQTSATKVEPTPVNLNSNQITVVNLTPLSKEESDAIDKERQKQIEIEQEKLKNVPAELKSFDFENFSYRTSGYGTIRLKNGSYRLGSDDKPSDGNLDVELKEIYYADLTGDGIKEAIVNLFALGCGGSCDGGSDLFFVYTMRRQKPKLIWHLETGTKADGGSIKSFTVKDKQIHLEIFGKCDIKENRLVPNGEFELPLNKFESKGASHYIFGFNGSRIVTLSKTLLDTPKASAGNYQWEIKIID